MGNEITTMTNRKSLMAVQKDYIESISKGLKDIIGEMNNYQSVCGYNILNAINTLLAKEGLNHSSSGVDKESINNAIKFAVIYQLNTDNKEVFVIIRKEKDRNGEFIKKVEVKPQYRGTLKIISSFGRNVEKIYPEWIVREGDDFSYATFKGIEVIPPTWTPKSSDGKVLRVVVPVRYKDGFIDYRIAEREGIATNIKAQIKQAVMFNADKDKILTYIKDLTTDQLINDKFIKDYINETYTGLSSEEMIITKLIINATKRVPIDYSSALARELLEETFDNSDVYKKSHNAKELIENQQTLIECKANEKPEIEYKADDNGVVETIEKVETPKQPFTSTKQPSLTDLFNDSDNDLPY